MLVIRINELEKRDGKSIRNHVTVCFGIPSCLYFVSFVFFVVAFYFHIRIGAGCLFLVRTMAARNWNFRMTLPSWMRSPSCSSR
jgi:hypothetical protein